MHRKFKYSATFDAIATFRHGKWKEAKASGECFADLSDLRALLPDDEEIGDNPDLLYTSFNAAVVNIINANDHGIATDTALAVSKYFVNRQMNIEHDRWEIVGHVITQGFSTFGDNKIKPAEAFAGTDQPFNIALGAVVYRVSRSYLAEFIEESADPKSYYHQELSTSWEIGFDEYDIVLGSRKIADATIVSDEEEKKKYDQYLRMNGGTGITDEGVPVYCLIKGDARPLGCAFTSNPAAPVKGLLTASTQGATALLESVPDPRLDQALAKIDALSGQLKEREDEFAKKLENIASNNSQIPKTPVIKNSMKFKSIDEITPELFANEGTASVNAIKEFIRDQITESATSALDKLTNEETARKAAEKSLKDSQDALAALQKEVDDLKAEKVQKEKQEQFDSRMEEIASEYELSDGQRKAVASQIKDLEDSAFTTWKNEIFVPFATKKKAEGSNNTTEQTDEDKEKERLEALKKAEASKDQAEVPNAQKADSGEVNYSELLKDVFTFNK